MIFYFPRQTSHRINLIRNRLMIIYSGIRGTIGTPTLHRITRLGFIRIRKFLTLVTTSFHSKFSNHKHIIRSGSTYIFKFCIRHLFSTNSLIVLSKSSLFNFLSEPQPAATSSTTVSAQHQTDSTNTKPNWPLTFIPIVKLFLFLAHFFNNLEWDSQSHWGGSRHHYFRPLKMESKEKAENWLEKLVKSNFQCKSKFLAWKSAWCSTSCQKPNNALYSRS